MVGTKEVEVMGGSTSVDDCVGVTHLREATIGTYVRENVKICGCTIAFLAGGKNACNSG
jgi:hypothetical protein